MNLCGEVFVIGRLGLLALFLFFGIGCHNEQQRDLGGESPDPPWEALDAFQARSQMLITYPASRRNWRDVAQASLRTDFRHAVAELERQPIPGEYAAREPALQAALESLRKLIAAAESGQHHQIRPRFEVADEALRRVRHD